MAAFHLLLQKAYQMLSTKDDVSCKNLQVQNFNVVSKTNNMSTTLNKCTCFEAFRIAVKHLC